MPVHLAAPGEEYSRCGRARRVKMRFPAKKWMPRVEWRARQACLGRNVRLAAPNFPWNKCKQSATS